jgi:pimeloyl-ACP methyl ester carboxylesterase
MIRRALPRLFALAVLALLSVTPPAAAKEVKLAFGGMTLNAVFTLAPGKTLADGIVLLTHGTMAHNDMQIIRSLRTLLQARGLNTLAINLSLSQDDRHGIYDCARPHRHKESDGPAEIAAWVAWLKQQGAGPITVLGHSRGGSQTARYAAAKPDPAVKKVVLVAPATWDAAKAAAAYEARNRTPLKPLLEKAEALVKTGKGDTIIEGVDFLTCPKSPISAATFVDYYGPEPRRDTPAVVGDIKLPVLVVVAGGDTIITDLPEKMKGRIGSNVVVKTVADADHFFNDLFADDLVDVVAAFVGESG